MVARGVAAAVREGVHEVEEAEVVAHVHVVEEAEVVDHVHVVEEEEEAEAVGHVHVVLGDRGRQDHAYHFDLPVLGTPPMEGVEGHFAFHRYLHGVSSQVSEAH